MRLKKNDQIYAMKVVKKELVHDDEVSVCPTKVSCGTQDVYICSLIWMCRKTSPKGVETGL